MKADPKTQAEVAQTFKGMFEAYKKRDLKATLSFWAPDPDVVVIGSGTEEKGIGLAQLTENLKRDWSQGEVLTIGVKDFLVSESGLVAWLSADSTFHVRVPEGEFDLAGRITGVMEQRNGKWLWVQMHFSTPSREQEPGQSWPKPNQL